MAASATNVLPKKSAKTDKVLLIGISKKLMSMFPSPVHFFLPDVAEAALEAVDGTGWLPLLELSLPLTHGGKSS